MLLAGVGSFCSAMVDPDGKTRSVHRPYYLAWGKTELLGRGKENCFAGPISGRARFFVLLVFVVLMLVAMFAYPMISTHPSLLHPFIVRPMDALSFMAPENINSSAFKHSLLEIARTDLSEPEEKKQISNLLDGAWDSFRDRLWNRPGRDLHDRLEATRLKFARAGQRLPAHLSSPRYAPYWSQFRDSLQRWVRTKRYEPQIMKQLLHLVKEPVDRHYKNIGKRDVVLGKPYKTCAVVGNSGILLNQSHARFIDSHDMVLRLNNARTAGFEDRVGSKTTLAFINSNILQACSRRTRCFCHPYGEDVPIVMYICQVVHFMDVALCGASQKAPIIVTDPRFDILCARIVKYYSLKNFVESTGRRPEDWSDVHDGPMFHYSSGMQAIVLALGICEKVSVFGFGKSPGAKHHYHTNQQGELHLHDYTAEYQFYHDLVLRRSSLVPFLNEAGFVIPQVEIYQ